MQAQAFTRPTSQLYVVFSGVLVLIYINILNVREHNLEAHFLCNRTGPDSRAEWASHIRKLRMSYFLKK